MDMEALSNTILLGDSYGKYLLTENEKYSGYAFGGLTIAGILGVIAFFVFNNPLYMFIRVYQFLRLAPITRIILTKLPKKQNAWTFLWNCNALRRFLRYVFYQ